MADTYYKPDYILPFWSFTDFVPTIPKLYWDVRSQEQRILNLFKLIDKLVNYVDVIASTYNQNADEIVKLQKQLDGFDDEIKRLFADYEYELDGKFDQLVKDVNRLVSTLRDEIADAYKKALDKANEYTDTELESYVPKSIYEAETSHLQLLIRELQENIVKLAAIIEQLQLSNMQWDVQHGMMVNTVDAQRDMFNDITVHSITIEELNELDMTVAELANSGLNVRGLAVMSYWLVNKFDLPNTFKYFEDPITQSNKFTADNLKAARVNQNGVVFVPEDKTRFESTSEFTADRLKKAKVNREGFVYVENVNNAGLKLDDDNINKEGE